MDISTAVVGDGVLVKGVDSAWKTVLLEVPTGLVVDVVSPIVGDGIIVVRVAFVSAVVNNLLVVGLSTVLETKT